MSGGSASVRSVIGLSAAAELPDELVGGKAAQLGRLAKAGFAVPPGIVITADAWSRPTGQLAAEITAALQEFAVHGTSFAVRSSAVAEDLPDASYAGLYETFLDVPAEQVAEAVVRCHQAATAPRVASYQTARGGADDSGRPVMMAVLVQPMIPAAAAGVAFTANPVTGDRAESVVAAVRGLGDRLVAGQTGGDEWRIRGGLNGIPTAFAARTDENAITAEQALSVAHLAREVEQALGPPQDIEWAIEATPEGRLWLLQARPMTALPDPADWRPPGPGLWMRNFRLGEWLPEPMTPLFADWLLPIIEDGYLDGMRDSLGVAFAFRYASVNGWYYNSVPDPDPRLLLRALTDTRGRIVTVLYHALVQVSRNPAAADRAILGGLEQLWRDSERPAYRELVAAGRSELAKATASEVTGLVARVGRAAGRQLWFLSIVGGSAWKMEECLTRFAIRHLPRLTAPDGPLADGIQVLLRALPGVDTQVPDHAVISIDWYWPTAGETTTTDDRTAAVGAAMHRQLVQQREAAETACLTALARAPGQLRQFRTLLDVTRRYTVTRDTQARDLTLGWPLLRACVRTLGEDLTAANVVENPDQVYFLTRSELETRSARPSTAVDRESTWQRQRRQPAPLTLGRPPRLIGDPLQRAVQAARGNRIIPDDAIVGQPASAGRATGPVRLITDPAAAADFRPGEVLVARTTAPAWTPLFAKAAAVVTDAGAITAHAAILAREYGIPAVVGTGDATHRLATGQQVLVDGSAGTVTLTDTPTSPTRGAVSKTGGTRSRSRGRRRTSVPPTAGLTARRQSSAEAACLFQPVCSRRQQGCGRGSGELLGAES